ncbi:MAG: alpha-amylase [Flavobacteriaceae bacterium]|nr:alpha-amylase [Flavobacteriaceae bacterium]
MRFSTLFFLFATLALLSCNNNKTMASKTSEAEVQDEINFTWEGATVYFLLTDRFKNGDPSNDVNFDRTKETAVLRGFEGGDIKGVTQKVEEGYFNDLGVNAIWLTPLVEQIHAGTDEGTGFTYGYHGYWTKDWTALDPNFGTENDLKQLVDAAHGKGIRILLDAVINHTGPATEEDGVWPDSWVRTSPKCEFTTYKNTIECTLVENLPDILTESDAPVELPPALEEKWKKEGRYETEIAELDEFFERTGHPRAPRFYIMKWLTDYITDYGIDGYRVDTVKHTEEYVWEEFRAECDYAFDLWKSEHPDELMDETPFYMVGEVYFYNIKNGQEYDFGDKKVDYFGNSFDALINFDLRTADGRSYEDIFSSYSQILNNEMDGFGTLSYVSSHDDGQPFDQARERTYESAIRLILAPGAAQVYYGDEVGRTLIVDGTNGDATLRSSMDWEDIQNNSETKNLLEHWQKLGRFRNAHMAVGAGVHELISENPYVFSRVYSEGDAEDKVVIALNMKETQKVIPVGGIFEDGTLLRDTYAGNEVVVENGTVTYASPFEIVLFEQVLE